MLARWANRKSAWLSSRQASQRLGVKLATLYAYASRGLISSVPGQGQRARLYASDDVERLRTRHAARSGHGPVAAAALRFGEPVLETSISDVGPDGPRYRGRLATELCRTGVSFERVAELLWTGSSTGHGGAFSSFELRRSAALAVTRRARRAAQDGAPARRVGSWRTTIATRPATQRNLPAPARYFIGWPRLRAGVRRRRKVGQRVAGTLLAALRVPQNPVVIDNVDRALVLCAEHELNASTFAARVAASAGADLYACLGAAVNTLSGSAHGGTCDRVEAMILRVTGARGRAHTARSVNEWLAHGEQLPGFGHPLYPAGDPRGALLIELAEAHGARSEPAKAAFALLEAMKRGGHPAPTLDMGLVTLCHCLALPAGSAASIFAVGRSAGWVAHALEQRAARYLLRPRARYVPSADTAETAGTGEPVR